MADVKPGDLDAFVEKVQRVLLEEAGRIYGPRVVDLWQNPRNMGPLAAPDGHARITGPCGDTMEIFLAVRDGRIARATFLTDGCGPSIASGGAVTELATGKTPSDAMELDQKAVLDAIGGLPEESAHCAKLASETLAAAVKDYLARMTT